MDSHRLPYVVVYVYYDIGLCCNSAEVQWKIQKTVLDAAELSYLEAWLFVHPNFLIILVLNISHTLEHGKYLAGDFQCFWGRLLLPFPFIGKI